MKLILWMLGIWLFGAQMAAASGLFLPARFVRNQAMGGTGIATGNDLTLLAENPGQLDAVTGGSAMVNYHLYYMDNRFDRVSEDGVQYARTSNVDGHFNHIPNVFLGHDFGVEDLTVALGVWSPIGPKHIYDPNGPQRYSMEFNQIQLLYTGLGASYRIIPQITVGATLAFAHVIATQHIGLMIIPEASSTDGLVKLEASSLFNPMGVFGVSITPVDRLHIGASYQTKVNVELEGTVSAEVPIITGPGVDYGSDNVVARQTIADIFRFGIGWEDDNYTIEAGLKYYRWSQYDSLEVDLETGNIGEFQLDDISIAKQNSDAMSFHLGGAYRIASAELRLGGYYDQTAIDPNYVSITEFDAPKFGLTLGAGYEIAGFRFGVAFMKVFYQEVVANDSQLAPIAAFPVEADIGTGTYHWNVMTFGGSVEYSF